MMKWRVKVKMKIHSFTSKIWLRRVSVTLLGIAVLSLPVFFAVPRFALAADASSCISSSGASNVASIQNACNLCYGSGSGSSRGTMWINDGNNGANSDVVEVTAEQAATGSVSIRLYGQVYSCSTGGSSSNSAYYIWFGDAGKMKQTDPHLDWISIAGTTLYRGTGTGAAHAWYSPLGQSVTGTINIAGFLNGASCTEMADGTKECIRVISINRCFSPIGSYQNTSGTRSGTCYGDDSTLILRIPGDIVIEEVGDGNFWSRSTVEIPAQNDVSYHKLESTDNGSVSVKVSTDADHLNVNFWHNVYYDETIWDPNAYPTTSASLDQFPDVCTDWDVQWREGKSGPVGSGSLCTGKSGGNSGKEVSRTNSFKIDLDPGETVKICQRISLDPVNITLSRKEHKHWVGTWPNRQYVHWYWEYTISSTSGTSYSEACAEVTRPPEPGGGGPYSTGTADSTIMFAGETASPVGWSTSALSVPTRRLVKWQAVVYRIPVSVGYYGTITKGTINTEDVSMPARWRGDGACGWYRTKSAVDYCNTIGGRYGDLDYGPTARLDTYNGSAAVVVPDTVGYKYCNSFAYRYTYYYAYVIDGSETWYEEPARAYWNVYDAACRTIAKKPSTGIWNGSMMTNGGVVTSSSPRFNNAIMGIETSVGGSRTLYGSWVEYLASVGKNVTYFSSASNFAIGSGDLSAPDSNSTPIILNNSQLTIANKTKLGSSGIGNNSTYRTRLTTFMENQATSIGDTLGATTITGTQIMKHTGTLKITGNIIAAPGPYSSIYHIPQAVIFVHGDLEIASDVTRIDAWLIVDGKINTCSNSIPGKAGFVSGSTESDAIGRPRDTCNKQLVFNGPVMAGKLELNRSFGSDPLITYRTGTFGAASTKYAAGEVFNLRADTYLWAYAQAGRYDSSYTESYSRELAPRY